MQSDSIGVLVAQSGRFAAQIAINPLQAPLGAHISRQLTRTGANRDTANNFCDVELKSWRPRAPVAGVATLAIWA